MWNRIILHIDMDAFFASVEQIDNPDYKGKPVIVGANPKGRGVVSAASYEARKYGIRSAMPISKAYKLCPGGIFVRPRYNRYVEVSNKIMNIIEKYSPCVEQISIDEAFIDCTGMLKIYKSPLNIAKLIKKEIYTTTGLTASVGVATNKSIAKIASDLEKPDGLSICYPEEEKSFLKDLPISRLYGVGNKTKVVLENMGIKRIGDIVEYDENILVRIFGKWGHLLYQFANGIDNRPVYPYSNTKSISEEHTFEVDEDDEDIILQTISVLCERVIRRLRSKNMMYKTVTLKIRLEGFETYTRSKTLIDYYNDMINLKKQIMNLYVKFGRGTQKVRLLGVKLSNLITNDNIQLELFDNHEKLKQNKIENIIDNVDVKRASLLKINNM